MIGAGRVERRPSSTGMLARPRPGDRHAVVHQIRVVVVGDVARSARPSSRRCGEHAPPAPRAAAFFVVPSPRISINAPPATGHARLVRCSRRCVVGHRRRQRRRRRSCSRVVRSTSSRQVTGRGGLRRQRIASTARRRPSAEHLAFMPPGAGGLRDDRGAGVGGDHRLAPARERQLRRWPMNPGRRDARRHRPTRCGSGGVLLNARPRPSRPGHDIHQPGLGRRQMARPRPVPPNLRVVEASA